jgi:hypothetical protein
MKCFFEIKVTLLAALSVGIAFASSVAPVPGMKLGQNSTTVRILASKSDIAEQDQDGKSTAKQYKFIPIEIPGATFVEPFEINNRRVVSGVYGDAAGNWHSFIWIRGQVFTVDNPAAQITAAGAITDNDLLFGNWGDQTEQHAGYYDLNRRKWVLLPDLPGYPLNIGQRMNNSGHAVGYACRSGTFFVPTDCDAWSWDGKEYSFYNFPGAMLTLPFGINERAQQVGLWEQSLNFYLGYRRDRGVVQDLTLSTDTDLFYPTAYDINNNGDILAAAPLDPNSYWPSIILHGPSSFERLPNYPGVLRTFYQGMNEHEDLVGIWFNDPSGFPYFGFVALRE